jgi:hypothetical protein
MQEFAPTKSRLSGDCLSDEGLAAYIDGALDKVEAARVARHLASCERCFEIYADTIEIQQDLEPAPKVVPFPTAAGGGSRLPWALPLAALLLAGIGSGAYFQFLATPPELVASKVAPPLPNLPPDAGPMWLGPTNRGPAEEDDEGRVTLAETSFRMGVQVVNLQACLKAGNAQQAEDVVAHTLQVLATQSVSEYLQNDYRAITGALVKGKPPADLLAEASRLEGIYRKDFEPGTPFDFGQWAEGGRLAAQSRDPSFFRRPDTQAFLLRLRWRDKFHDLLRIDKLDPTARESLDRISEIGSGRNLQPADYDRLKAQFDAILGRYYPDR